MVDRAQRRVDRKARHDAADFDIALFDELRLLRSRKFHRRGSSGGAPSRKVSRKDFEGAWVNKRRECGCVNKVVEENSTRLQSGGCAWGIGGPTAFHMLRKLAHPG